MNIPKVSFTEIRACFGGDRLKAFDIISRHFPLQNAAPVDLETPHHEGGSFLTNFNLSIVEANIAIEVLKELKCDCYFIVPIASWRGFPASVMREFKTYLNAALDAITVAKDMPPYFAVHTLGRAPHCAEQFKNLAIAHLMDADDVMKRQNPNVHRVSHYSAMAAIAKARKSSQS